VWLPAWLPAPGSPPGTSAPWCSSPPLTFFGYVTASCPGQSPPRTRLLPDLVTEEFCQERLLRVHEPCSLTEAVVLTVTAELDRFR
jgi:hypothetical protein